MDLAEYLRSIGMGELLVGRVSALQHQFMEIANEPIEDVVVSEYVTENGQREYEGVVFFSPSFAYEVSKLMSDLPKMWIATLTKNIAYIELIPKDYDFHEITPASRLSFRCNWQQGSPFELAIKASSSNCPHLLRIIKQYIQPNLV